MAYKYIEFTYPQSHLFHKELFWINKNCNCYFAFKLNDTDNWTYYAGNASHGLEVGKFLTSYYALEADAITNYLTTVRDTTSGKVIAVLPLNFQAKYARIYIESGSAVRLFEWQPSIYITANEIISGTLEVTDQLSDSPKVTVVSDGVTRLKLGNIVATSYGLAGYNSSAATIFELSNRAQNLAGWDFTATHLTKNNTTISNTGFIKLGTGNDVAYISAANATYREWIGHENPASAPLRITKGGKIYADGAQITGTVYLTNMVMASNLAASSVTTTKIAVGAVTAGRITVNTITATQMSANSITATQLKAGAVTAVKISAGTITATQMSALSISAAAIRTGVITATQLAALSISADKIRVGVITATQMSANSITATLIRANAITTTKIVAGAVTATQIAANTITAAKIKAGVITATEIKVRTITASNLNVQTVTNVEIKNYTITATNLAVNSVTASAIRADAVTAAEIKAGTITATQMSANSITATIIRAGGVKAENIRSNTITATQMSANSITATIIRANAVNATHINVVNLAAINANLGAVNAGYIHSSSLFTKGTYLTTSCTATVTTLQVGSTVDFTVTGSAWIIDSSNDRDKFNFAATTSTTLTGCAGVLAHTVSAANKPLVVPVVKGMYISDAVNEMRFWGDRGDGTAEELANIGVNQSGSDYIIGWFGSRDSSRIAVYGVSSSSNGMYGYSATGTAIYGQSGNPFDGFNGQSIGVYGDSSAGKGVVGNSNSNYGVYGCSVSNNGVRGYSASGYSVYSDGTTYLGGNATIKDASWLGLDAAKGRILFTDAATDTITISDANLIVGSLTLPTSGTAFRLPVYSAANVMTELAAVGATGQYLAGNTGAIPSWDTVASILPWLIDIDVFSLAASHTNWATLKIDSGMLHNGNRQSTAANQNAEVSWPVVLGAGTWTIELCYTTYPDSGIVTVYLDAVSVGTIDTYAAAGVYNVFGSITGISVTPTAKYTLKLKMETKNAASSGYNIRLNHVKLLRTA